jgi:hypothetical protein
VWVGVGWVCPRGVLDEPTGALALYVSKLKLEKCPLTCLADLAGDPFCIGVEETTKTRAPSRGTCLGDLVAGLLLA